MTRAALYARVSTGMQDTGMQLDELRQVAAQRGWKVVREYVDEAVTTRRARRPELDRMRADVQAGRVDVVVVWKLDRMGRSVKELLDLLEEFTQAGAAFLSLHDPGMDTTTPSGRLLTVLLAAFAQFERDVLSERTRAGVARARALGKPIGRPRKTVTPEAVATAVQAHGSQRHAAEALQVSPRTLRRRLSQAEGGAKRSLHGPAKGEVGP